MAIVVAIAANTAAVNATAPSPAVLALIPSALGWEWAVAQDEVANAMVVTPVTSLAVALLLPAASQVLAASHPTLR